MSNLLEARLGASATDRDTHRPVILRADDPADRAALEELLKREKRVTVHDQLDAQLRELVRTMHPAVKWQDDELSEAVRSYLGGRPTMDYGNWVYYPWSFNLVHLLGETEFARLRTDRNRNKITSEEQATLATKRVGVIGLSVGQSVSLALALERSFGELRLADFDSLDLSNLNRIRSGVHELGLNKAVVAARAIAEIDPYLVVKVFKEGITEGNLESFLTEGGKLDVLVEECDDAAIKIKARLRAKALRIPVVMDTSDRGMIDVERFDLEPQRPIMHGMLSKLDLGIIDAPMTREQKTAYIMAMVNPAGLSERMKRSIPEIGRNLSTWPQLGGHVMLGGSVTAEVVRRIALDEMTWSGRWYVDLESLLHDSRSVLLANAMDFLEAPAES